MSTHFLCIFSRKKISYLEWDVTIFKNYKIHRENQINLNFLFTHNIYDIFSALKYSNYNLNSWA